MVVEALLLLLITREQPLFTQNHLKQVYCDISESFCNYVFRFFCVFLFYFISPHHNSYHFLLDFLLDHKNADI